MSVTILPSARTGLDVLGEHLGAGMQRAMPQMYENMKYQRGLEAINQAEKNIANAGDDPYKIALEFAKVGAAAPGLERALGPLMQTALQRSSVNRAFPNTPGQQPSQTTNAETQPNLQQAGLGQQQLPQTEEAISMPRASESTFATPSAFNVMTPDQIAQDSERYAIARQDPSAYQERQAQLNNQNNAAITQKEALEDSALKTGVVRANDLPRYMQVGSKFDPSNPSEWVQKTNKEYQKIKSNDDKILRSFIPGTGSALFGKDRKEALKRLEPTVQDNVKKGLEQETRITLADEYLSPTEIETMIHPLSSKHEKALQGLPKGIWPAQKIEKGTGLPYKEPTKSPFITYEEAKIKAPRELQIMQDRLSDFFLKNVDKETSLLGLREKLWEDKDYDWRQIGPAIRQAMEKGLTLEPFQSTEMADIETNPPLQSLPDIFMDLDRYMKGVRGNR